MTAHRRTGFTLVELLVVVGVIAMLIAMLLPALGAARAQAARVACASNLRQVAIASLAYAADSHEYLPYPNWLSADGAYKGPGWLYQAGAAYTADSAQAGVLWPYLRAEAVYRCGADAGPFAAGTTHLMTSYVMNGAVCAFGRHVPSFKAHQFRTDAILFWEAKSGWNDGSDFPNEGMTTRHANGSDVAAVDGHVDRLPAAAYAKLLTRSPGPLWCTPGSPDGH